MGQATHFKMAAPQGRPPISRWLPTRPLSCSSLLHRKLTLWPTPGTRCSRRGLPSRSFRNSQPLVPSGARGGERGQEPFAERFFCLYCAQRWGVNMPDQDNASGSEEAAGDHNDNVCRDFLRNVCKRGSRCRFRHPETNAPEPGVSKNEFIFCHDFQNKECVRLNCKFIHGNRQDEEYYKKCGELPPHLQQKVAANLGVLPTELSNSKEEVPICRDFLKGECLRGTKCKFRHLQRDFELKFDYNYQFNPKSLTVDSMLVAQSTLPAMRRFDPYTNLYATNPYEDLSSMMKRRRVDGTQMDVCDYSAMPVRPVEQRMLEEEAVLLRKHVEELKKQASVLEATNEVLLAQNAQFRQHQAKMMALNSVVATSEMGSMVTNYNHGIAQTHTTLSSHALLPHLVSQHGRMTSSIQTTAQVGATN